MSPELMSPELRRRWAKVVSARSHAKISYYVPGIIRHEVLAAVGRWVRKAEGDFGAAGALARVDSSRYADAICFHAQQCVEKYLKARLVCEGIHF
jgi:hypothetical protein